MAILARLAQWKERGIISPDQHLFLDGLVRGEPFSVFLELNVMLYAGVVAFVGGLGWTVSTWSQRFGDLALLALLTALCGASLWYCFSRAAAWTRNEAASPNLVFDYVLYFGCLVWSVELAWIEGRFELLGRQSDLYLLLTAGLYFFLAYRFDNRFVLSLALSSLAGWFGLALSRGMAFQTPTYRQYGILFALLAGGAGAALARAGVKPHFLGTYTNLAANVLLLALLSGVFERENSGWWLLALLAACGACLAWGLARRQFAFVAYAAVYGYFGVSAVLLRDARDLVAILAYFLVTGIAMVVVLIVVARRFGREK